MRQHLVSHMVNSIQRLGFSPTATLEHRKLAVELAEVIINWEYGIKEEASSEPPSENFPLKHSIDDAGESQRKRLAVSGPSGSTAPLQAVKPEPGVSKPIERAYTDTVIIFLLRLACHCQVRTKSHLQFGFRCYIFI